VQIATRTLLETTDPAALTTLLAERGVRGCCGPRLGPHAVVVHNEPRLRRILVHQGLLVPPAYTVANPQAHDDSASAYHLVLALRLAGHIAPQYTSQFARLAGEIGAQLTPTEHTALADLEAMIIPPIDTGEPVPSGEDPEGLLPAEQVRPLVAAALAEDRFLRVRYFSATTSRVRSRIICPLALTSGYLSAYCLRTHATRSFRLDRFLALELLGTPPGVPPPPALTPDLTPASDAPGAELLPDYGE
jgi:hypothetical protein